MWYCEASSKDISISSKSCHIKTTAYTKNSFTFRVNNDLTNKKLVFDEPNNKELDNILVNANIDCIKNVHRFKYKYEYK